MKHVKIAVCLLFVSVLLVSVMVPLTNPTTNSEMTHSISRTSVLSYESHDYFYIHNDSELTATAAAESWEGNGSPETPFLIQGYEINPMIEDIHIENTRLHFKILDCNISGALGGIALENVTNGVIQNCLFTNNEYGIYLRNDTGIDILECNFSVPDSYGESAIYLDTVIDCSIQNCVLQGITGSDAGIYGTNSEGITVFNCTVFEFDDSGIYFVESDDLEILNNTVYWNEGYYGTGPNCGIQISSGLVADISGNNITENADNGITISGVDNVTITENYIIDNLYNGVFVELCDNCLIQDNYIEGNGEGGVRIYLVDFCQIIGNEFWSNALNSIAVISSDLCYIYNNYLNHSDDHGMYIYDSLNTTIEENEIYNSYGLGSGSIECGIFVEEGNYASLLHNTLGNNSENGITVYAAGNGEIIGNTIFESDVFGILLTEASDWEIFHNVIFDCGGPGIYMDVPTDDNLLYSNDIGWCSGSIVVDEGFGNYWNYTNIGNWYSDYNGTGTYTISGASAEVDYYPSMSLYCGTATPSQYEVGTTGNTMTWSSSALNPGSYELLIDGVSQGLVVWDGGPVVVNVDGLSVGEYNVTLIVYHISGHWVASPSVLTVVDTEAPTWTVTPDDQVLDYNEPLSYQLEASDPSGIASWAVNDTTTFAISASGLLTNVTSLESGIYYVQITVTDVYTNAVSVTIMITVNNPTTTTTTTSSTPSNPTVLILAVGGAGATVVVVLVILLYKKKSS